MAKVNELSVKAGMGNQGTEWAESEKWGWECSKLGVGMQWILAKVRGMLGMGENAGNQGMNAENRGRNARNQSENARNIGRNVGNRGGECKE